MPKTQYNQPAYWQQKYKVTNCQQYQWIQDPEKLFKLISKHIDYKKIQNILQIGCGTSIFLSKLKLEIDARKKKNSYTCTCIDFSKQLIRKYRNDKIKSTQATYICTDVREMKKSLNQQQFDYIFDKGCIDCLFCENNFIKQVIKALRECYKVLKMNGKLIIISHGKPKNRVYLFRNKLVPFSVQVQRIQYKKDKKLLRQVYIYICTKVQNAEQNNQDDGNVLSQGQKSDNQQEVQENKNKQNQGKNKKQIKQKQQKQQKQKNQKKQDKQKKQEKQQNQPKFILQQKKNKKQKNSQKQNEAPFILQQQQSKIKEKKYAKKQTKKQSKNLGKDQIKKQKQKQKQQQAPFILSQKQQEAKFILGEQQEEDDQQKNGQENNIENQENENENQQNQQKQNEQQQEKEQQAYLDQQQNQQQNQQGNKEQNEKSNKAKKISDKAPKKKQTKYQDDFQQV